MWTIISSSCSPNDFQWPQLKTQYPFLFLWIGGVSAIGRRDSYSSHVFLRLPAGISDLFCIFDHFWSETSHSSPNFSHTLPIVYQLLGWVKSTHCFHHVSMGPQVSNTRNNPCVSRFLCSVHQEIPKVCLFIHNIISLHIISIILNLNLQDKKQW